MSTSLLHFVSHTTTHTLTMLQYNTYHVAVHVKTNEVQQLILTNWCSDMLLNLIGQKVMHTNTLC